MPQNTEPSSPRDAYKAIIDQFVEESYGMSERLVRESGIYSKVDGWADANELVRSMKAEQRSVLARMLHEERVSAIAGALSILTWWITCRDVAISFRGEPMPFELTEEGLHGDFVGRCNGWQWLDGDEKVT
jgi:hypothetical protein